MTPTQTQTALNAKYTQIWAGTKNKIAANAIAIDPLPKAGEPRWGVSTVIRPVMPNAVWSELEKLKRFTGPKHSFYTPHGIHMTLRSNELYRVNPQPDEPIIQAYAEAFQDAWNGGTSISLHGFIAVPTSLLICGHPDFDVMALRTRYYDELADRGAIRPGPDDQRDKQRDICHASMAMWAEPLKEPHAFVDTINDLQNQNLGTITSFDVDVVWYTRTPLNVNVHKLQHILRVEAPKVHAVI